MWDCGGDWDGYSQPMHAGLDDETRDDFIQKLGMWNMSCYQLATATRRTACLSSRAPKSIKSAVQLAKRTEYMQEVCGTYIDEAVKNMLDNPGMVGGFIALAVLFPIAAPELAAAALAVGTAQAVLAVEVAMQKARSNGWMKNYLSDETSTSVTKYPYR